MSSNLANIHLEQTFSGASYVNSLELFLLVTDKSLFLFTDEVSLFLKQRNCATMPHIHVPSVTDYFVVCYDFGIIFPVKNAHPKNCGDTSNCETLPQNLKYD